MADRGVDFHKGFAGTKHSKSNTTSMDRGAGSSGGKGMTKVGNMENSGKYMGGANTNAPSGSKPSGKGEFISPAKSSK